jgi:hypothetical protein
MPGFCSQEEGDEVDSAEGFDLDASHSRLSIKARVPDLPVRRKGVLAPVGGEAEDPLGLDVETGAGSGFPEEQLQVSIFGINILIINILIINILIINILVINILGINILVINILVINIFVINILVNIFLVINILGIIFLTTTICLTISQEMFPESTGEIGSERFDPAYFLLEHHHTTPFDDLKVGAVGSVSCAVVCSVRWCAVCGLGVLQYSRVRTM